MRQRLLLLLILAFLLLPPPVVPLPNHESYSPEEHEDLLAQWARTIPASADTATPATSSTPSVPTIDDTEGEIEPTHPNNNNNSTPLERQTIAATPPPFLSLPGLPPAVVLLPLTELGVPSPTNRTHYTVPILGIEIVVPPGAWQVSHARRTLAPAPSLQATVFAWPPTARFQCANATHALSACSAALLLAPSDFVPMLPLSVRLPGRCGPAFQQAQPYPWVRALATAEDEAATWASVARLDGAVFLGNQTTPENNFTTAVAATTSFHFGNSNDGPPRGADDSILTLSLALASILILAAAACAVAFFVRRARKRHKTRQQQLRASASADIVLRDTHIYC